MKLKSDFVLRKMGEEHVVMPLGKNADRVDGLVRLSESAAFLWQLLSSEQTIESLALALTEEYDVDLPRAAGACEKFIAQLRDIGCLE